MSNPLPLALLYGSERTFFDDNGGILSGGSLTFTVAGSGSSAQLVYADPQGSTSLGSVVTLGSDGKPNSGSGPTGIYILPTGYRVTIKDVDGNTVNTQDSFEDVGSSFLSTYGQQLAAGSKSVGAGYVILNTDNTVTVGTPGAIYLQPSAQRGLPITIQNQSNGVVNVTPNTGEFINGSAVNVVLPLPAASGTTYPTVTLNPDGVSTYYTSGAFGLG